MAHKTPPEWTRFDVQDPAMKTKVLESPGALPVTCNKLPSMDGAPPLLETPNGAPSLSSYACG